MVYVKKIKIKDFKCFDQPVEFEFTPDINLITGKNGLGKTSVLDAITWCLTGKSFSGSNQSYKPKQLEIDNSNPYSKVKDQFFTDVEVTLAFDNDQPDVIVRRTSPSGKATLLYLNGVVNTQKTTTEYLKQFIGFDVSKLFIYCNPLVLFDTTWYSQEEAGKILFAAVRHKVKDELADLYSHLFDKYKSVLSFCPDNSLEKAIGLRILNSVSRELNNNVNENSVLEDLQAQVAENLQTLATKTETIKSQEINLQEYYKHQKQEQAFKDLEAKLDQAEQQLRALTYQQSQKQKELAKVETDIKDLLYFVNNFNKLLSTNPSPKQIKIAFGLLPPDNDNITVLKPIQSKIRCPICGNLYTPKTPANQILQKLDQHQASLSEQDFDYVPHLAKIKKQIDDLKVQQESLLADIQKFAGQIKVLEYPDFIELQKERNMVANFNASLTQGKNIFKLVEAMKETCKECEIKNKYLNLMISHLQLYIKNKLKVIMQKLNQNLHSGWISLFKLQTNGCLKEQITILDRVSNVPYSDTNQSMKVRLGIEVCKLLQEFNGINFPIFIDEISMFSDYSFINDIGHQILATLPTPSDLIQIQHHL